MRLELREDAAVDFFKNELRVIDFVAQTDYQDIEKRLDILADAGAKKCEQVESAQWMWEFFVLRSLRDITENLRGFDQLRGYFREYIRYEDLLSAIDDNHRDHVIHPIWVMIVGFWLRKTFAVFTSFDYHLPNVAKGTEAEAKVETYIKETVDIVRKHEASLWCLIALTHDLGYSIQKTRKANEKMARMIDNFGFLSQRDFDFSFTAVHQTALEELLNMLSSEVIWLNYGAFKVARSSGGRLDYAKSFERLDHGVMSAYLLLHVP